MSLSEKKYGFTGETMEFEGHTLRRIYYLRNVSSMRKGDVGGWIESEDNLSHEGNCLVRDEAKVFGHAKVTDNAWIYANAIVKDNAQIKDDAILDEEVVVGADTIVAEHAWIGGTSTVFFYADENYGKPNILGDSEITSCIIEATGSICNSNVISEEISGPIMMDLVIQF